MGRSKPQPTKIAGALGDGFPSDHSLQQPELPEVPKEEQTETGKPGVLSSNIKQVLHELTGAQQDDGQDGLSKDAQIRNRLHQNMSNLPVLYDQFLSSELESDSFTLDWYPDWLHQDSGWGFQAVVHGLESTEDEPTRLVFQPVRVLSTNRADPDAETGRAPCMVRYESYMPAPVAFPHTGGSIDRARLMPQAPQLVATKTIGTGLFLYSIESAVSYLESIVNNATEDESEDYDEPDVSQAFKAQLGSVGTAPPAGFGLSWSPVLAGKLISTCDNGTISLIQLDSLDSLAAETSAAGSATEGHTSWFRGCHSKGVNDVTWVPAGSALAPHVFASVGEDGELAFWDTRVGQSHVLHFVVHKGPANTLDFSPFEPYMLITGGDDARLNVIDVRHVAPTTAGGQPCPPQCHVHTVLAAHNGAVQQVCCSPLRGGLVAAADADSAVLVWDLHAKNDGVFSPRQLRMRHVLHAEPVADLAWSKCEGLPLVASVSQAWVPEREPHAGQPDILQVWTPSQDVM